MAGQEPKTYNEHAEQRRLSTEAILESLADKRIVVAGPGTGKSFLFQELCRRRIERGEKNILTLSFINELVDDLARDLHELSEVKTLHGFALSLIPGRKRMFLGLCKVIQADQNISSGKDVNYNNIFNNLLDAEDELRFYSKRRKYYGFFSPNCSIYTLLKVFENDPDRIPSYSQILIDEFQDFNRLESRLIDVLSARSPILIVGDDDQSLYDFKSANPAEIRARHQSGEFTSFELPYCSRCTRVTIGAFHRVLEEGKSQGLASTRLPKAFEYFPSVEKNKVSDANDKIMLRRQVFDTSLAYTIDEEIARTLDPRSKELPSVLIVCPYRKQIARLEQALRTKGYKNIDASQKRAEHPRLDGLGFLLKSLDCNLGWRMVFQDVCEQSETMDRFAEVLHRSINEEKPFKDLLESSERGRIRDLVATLRKIQKGKAASDEKRDHLLEHLGMNPHRAALANLRESLSRTHAPKNMFKNIPIKLATILGSKGLTRDYSFLVHFDDKYLLEKDSSGKLVPTDGKLYGFLVALTRARTRVHIYTSQATKPLFVSWMGNDLIQDIT